MEFSPQLSPQKVATFVFGSLQCGIWKFGSGADLSPLKASWNFTHPTFAIGVFSLPNSPDASLGDVLLASDESILAGNTRLGWKRYFPPPHEDETAETWQLSDKRFATIQVSTGNNSKKTFYLSTPSSTQPSYWIPYNTMQSRLKRYKNPNAIELHAVQQHLLSPFGNHNFLPPVPESYPMTSSNIDMQRLALPADDEHPPHDNSEISVDTNTLQGDVQLTYGHSPVFPNIGFHDPESYNASLRDNVSPTDDSLSVTNSEPLSDTPSIVFQGGFSADGDAIPPFTIRQPVFNHEGNKLVLADDVDLLIAAAKVARPALMDPEFLQLSYSHDPEVIRTISKASAAGGMVLVTGNPLPGPPIELNEDTMRLRFRREMDERLLVHDAIMREARKADTSTNPTVRVEASVSIKELLDTIESDQHCYNALDISGLHNTVPWTIHAMDSNLQSMTTSHLGETLRRDKLLVSQWTIITHPDFLTEPHQDANGSGTWMLIVNSRGGKVWIYARWKPNTTRETMVQETTNCTSGMLQLPSQDLYYIVLKPGDLLIQPPVKRHMVYTTAPCIAVGGHYYNPAISHWTEIGRQVDAANSGGCTNHEHLAVPGIVVHMMCSLPKLSEYEELPVLGVKALCRMVLCAEEYSDVLPGFVLSELPAAFPPTYQEETPSSSKAGNKRKRSTRNASKQTSKKKKLKKDTQKEPVLEVEPVSEETPVWITNKVKGKLFLRSKDGIADSEPSEESFYLEACQIANRILEKRGWNIQDLIRERDEDGEGWVRDIVWEMRSRFI